MSDVYLIVDHEAVARVSVDGLERATDRIEELWDDESLDADVPIVRTTEEPQSYDVEYVSSGDELYVDAVVQNLSDRFSIIETENIDYIFKAYMEYPGANNPEES